MNSMREPALNEIFVYERIGAYSGGLLFRSEKFTEIPTEPTNMVGKKRAPIYEYIGTMRDFIDLIANSLKETDAVYDYQYSE